MNCYSDLMLSLYCLNSPSPIFFIAKSNSLSSRALSLGIIPINGTVFDTVFPNKVVSIQSFEMKVHNSNNRSCSVASIKLPRCISTYSYDSGNTVSDTKFMVKGCN